VVFSLLSLQATRNSHQFAAVVGTVTAWNFAEWAAAIGRRRAEVGSSSPTRPSMLPRWLTAGAIAAVLAWVGSGWFYEMTGEKRTIGWGEDRVFFPHRAAQFAGRPEMPERFLSFHNGHASLFEYYHGPQRKVFTDPRLEVAGADLYQRYNRLEQLMREDQPGWQGELDQMGRPVVLADHEYNAPLGATLLRNAHWRCVWFDPIAAVFVHDSAAEAARAHEVDFAARHFRPDSSDEPRGLVELKAEAAALRTYVLATGPDRGDLRRPLAWLGLDRARRALQIDPASADAWELLGNIELFREVSAEPSPRYQFSFQPVFDLSIVRATYALRRALELAPKHFRALWMLRITYERRLMYEAALPLADRMVALQPINRLQEISRLEAESKRIEFRRKLGSPAPASWRNLSELDQSVSALLSAGRAESAAELLEQANPPDRASWEVLDRIATIRLHLGEPARARALWEKAASVPEPAFQPARIGATYLVEGNFESARRMYQQALKTQPGLFEAEYSLAVLEQDAGDAQAAYDLALEAIARAPDEPSRAAARSVAASVSRFNRRPIETATPRKDARPGRIP
jgi:tetratricopeptide (TPR) repeat protein